MIWGNEVRIQGSDGLRAFEREIGEEGVLVGARGGVERDEK
jgi:hypothetical protein